MATPTGSVKVELTRRGWVNQSLDDIEVPAEGIDLGDVVLQPGVDLLGTTVDGRGRPIPDADVAMFDDPQQPFFSPTTTSDEKGKFTILDLEGDREIYLQARGNKYVEKPPLKVVLPQEGEAEVEVEMAPERTLEGFVLSAEDDRAIAGAQLNLIAQIEISSGGMTMMAMSTAVSLYLPGATSQQPAPMLPLRISVLRRKLPWVTTISPSETPLRTSWTVPVAIPRWTLRGS